MGHLRKTIVLCDQGSGASTDDTLVVLAPNAQIAILMNFLLVRVQAAVSFDLRHFQSDSGINLHAMQPKFCKFFGIVGAKFTIDALARQSYAVNAV